MPAGLRLAGLAGGDRKHVKQPQIQLLFEANDIQRRVKGLGQRLQRDKPLEDPLFISIVGGAQLALGVYRFYHKTDDEVEKKQVVSTSFILVGILALFVAEGSTSFSFSTLQLASFVEDL